MKAKEVKELAAVWQLADKDPGTKMLCLRQRTVHVVALHAEAIRRLKKGSDPFDVTEPVMVDGAKFVGALALFDDEAELTVKQTGSSLILTAGGRRAVLRAAGTTPLTGLQYEKIETLDIRRLRAVLPFLRACVSQGVQRPILTGICFKSKGGSIALTGSDASFHTGRVSIRLAVKAPERVVPANDLDMALGLLAERVGIRFVKNHMYLADRHTIIKLSLLSGAYPDLTKLTYEDTYPQHVSFPLSSLVTAMKAAVLFDNDRLVALQVKDGRAAWVVSGSEVGGFRVPIGKRDVPDINITLDAHTLEPVAQLGEKVTLHYVAHDQLVLFTAAGTKRRLWVSPMVQRTSGKEAMPDFKRVEGA